ncbi:MAG: hypothetical protein KC635_07310 [Myxococcales bacterium]|nr:hypothetical protein [Myxococcales bacterium]
MRNARGGHAITIAAAALALAATATACDAGDAGPAAGDTAAETAALDFVSARDVAEGRAWLDTRKAVIYVVAPGQTPAALADVPLIRPDAALGTLRAWVEQGVADGWLEPVAAPTPMFVIGATGATDPARFARRYAEDGQAEGCADACGVVCAEGHDGLTTCRLDCPCDLVPSTPENLGDLETRVQSALPTGYGDCSDPTRSHPECVPEDWAIDGGSTSPPDHDRRTDSPLPEPFGGEPPADPFGTPSPPPGGGDGGGQSPYGGSDPYGNGGSFGAGSGSGGSGGASGRGAPSGSSGGSSGRPDDF